MSDLRTSLLAVGTLAEGDTLDVLATDGFRMVVTNVDCSAGAGAFTPLLGFQDLASGGTWLYLLTSGVLPTSAQWSGRQAFDPGSGFKLNAHIGGWDFRVTGWLLTLP